MHPGSLLRMEWFVHTYLTAERMYNVLDVGSFDVNGSYKNFFVDKKFVYTGLDMLLGPNVDLVPENPYKWTSLKDNSFDVVISGQVFEHAEFFWWTWEEMIRVLKPSGYVSVVVPYLIERHRYPIDCYRFDSDALMALARYANLIPIHISTCLAPVGAPDEWYDPDSGDSFLIASKPENWKGFAKPETYKFKEEDLVQYRAGFIERDEQRVYADKVREAKRAVKFLKQHKKQNRLFKLKQFKKRFFG